MAILSRLVPTVLLVLGLGLRSAFAVNGGPIPGHGAE